MALGDEEVESQDIHYELWENFKVLPNSTIAELKAIFAVSFSFRLPNCQNLGQGHSMIPELLFPCLWRATSSDWWCSVHVEVAQAQVGTC